MRKIIVLTFMTLDGGMQAPGGPEEDTSSGFKYGGWSASYGDEVFNREKQMAPTDILLGRKTFDIFANTGQNMPTIGRVSMTSKNTSYPIL